MSGLGIVWQILPLKTITKSGGSGFVGKKYSRNGGLMVIYHGRIRWKWLTKQTNGEWCLKTPRKKKATFLAKIARPPHDHLASGGISAQALPRFWAARSKPLRPGRLTAGTWDYIHPWKRKNIFQTINLLIFRGVCVWHFIILVVWRGSL